MEKGAQFSLAIIGSTGGHVALKCQKKHFRGGSLQLISFNSSQDDSTFAENG